MADSGKNALHNFSLGPVAVHRRMDGTVFPVCRRAVDPPGLQ